MRLFRYFFYHKYCHIFMREQERTKLNRDYPSYRRILNVISLKLFLKFCSRGQPSTFTSQFPFSTKTSTPWNPARRKLAALQQLEMWTPPRLERNDPYRRFLPWCLAIVVQTSFVSIVCIHIIRAKTGHHIYKNNSRGIAFEKKAYGRFLSPFHPQVSSHRNISPHSPSAISKVLQNTENVHQTITSQLTT